MRDICSCAGTDVGRGEGSVVINVGDDNDDDNNNKGDNDDNSADGCIDGDVKDNDGGGNDNDPNDDKDTDEEDDDDDKDDINDSVDFDAINECDEDSAACILLYFKEVAVKLSINGRREVALKE